MAQKSSVIKLLSLPPDTVGRIHDLENLDADDYFCSCDPPGSKLGSGGGTTWILDEWERSGGEPECKKNNNSRRRTEPETAGVCSGRKNIHAGAGVSLEAWAETEPKSIDVAAAAF